MTARPTTSRYRQQGATLIITLVILALIMQLGIAAMLASDTQFRLSGNLQFEDMALNRAEAAIAAGESWLATGDQDAGFAHYNPATPQLHPIGHPMRPFFTGCPIGYMGLCHICRCHRPHTLTAWGCTNLHCSYGWRHPGSIPCRATKYADQLQGDTQRREPANNVWCGEKRRRRKQRAGANRPYLLARIAAHRLKKRPSMKRAFPTLPQFGFSLIELLIAVAIVGILATFALPSYSRYMVRASRAAAQSELLALAALQEKIYLNSSSYAYSLTATYNGTASASSGLGKTTGKTQDAKYSLSLDINTPSQTYILTATPMPGSTQALDGKLSVDQSGKRLWGNTRW